MNGIIFLKMGRMGRWRSLVFSRVEKLMNWWIIERGHPLFAVGQEHTSFNHVSLMNKHVILEEENHDRTVKPVVYPQRGARTQQFIIGDDAELDFVVRIQIIFQSDAFWHPLLKESLEAVASPCCPWKFSGRILETLLGFLWVSLFHPKI